MTKFSFFRKPVSNKTPEPDPISLKELHSLVTGGEYKERTDYHRTLTPAEQDGKWGNKAKAFDYICANGVFRTAEDSGILKEDGKPVFSGIFVADIDGQQNLPEIIEALKNDKKMQVAFLFISPGGDGIKAFYPIPMGFAEMSGSNKMKAYWTAIQEHFKQNYSALIIPSKKGHFIDEACKDLSRRTFICYDSQAYINENATEIEVVRKEETFDKKTTSSNTTIQGIAKRHLLKENNHGIQLRKFIWAVINLSLSQEVVSEYIDDYVSIDPKSKYFERRAFEQLVSDLYEGKGEDNGGAVKLTQDSFGMGFFLFKRGATKRYDIYSLYDKAVTQFLHDAGYYKMFLTEDNSIFIKKEGVFISQVSVENIKDSFKSEIDRIDKDVMHQYQGNSLHTTVAGMRHAYDKSHSTIFTSTYLQILPAIKEKILHDTEDSAFFFYQNCVVAVMRCKDSKGVVTVFQQYNEVKTSGYVVWKNQVIPRNLILTPQGKWYQESKFFDFLQNVTKNNPLALMCAVGYLIHNHYGPGMRKAVELTDSSLNVGGRREGGTGKGIIAQAIKEVRKGISIVPHPDMAKDKFRNSLIVPGTQVIIYDEVPAGFDLSFVFTDITGTLTVEKKGRDAFQIPMEYSPKLLICTNTVLKGDGTSYERRLITIELDSFYQKLLKANPKAQPVFDTHGTMFFKEGWNAEEYHPFDMVMLRCISLYFEFGLQDADNPYYLRNKLISSHTEKFMEWCDGMSFKPDYLYETRILLISYNAAAGRYPLGQRKFSMGIAAYTKILGWFYENNTNGGFVMRSKPSEKEEKEAEKEVFEEEMPF